MLDEKDLSSIKSFLYKYKNKLNQDDLREVFEQAESGKQKALLYEFFTENLNISNVLDYIHTVPTGVFEGADNITTIIVPKNVVSLQNGAFQNIPNLTKVVFESNHISDLPHNCFNGCPNLKEVHFLNNMSSYGPGSFDNNVNNLIIFVNPDSQPPSMPDDLKPLFADKIKFKRT